MVGVRGVESAERAGGGGGMDRGPLLAQTGDRDEQDAACCTAHRMMQVSIRERFNYWSSVCLRRKSKRDQDRWMTKKRR